MIKILTSISVSFIVFIVTIDNSNSYLQFLKLIRSWSLCLYEGGVGWGIKFTSFPILLYCILRLKTTPFTTQYCILTGGGSQLIMIILLKINNGIFFKFSNQDVS